MCVLFAWGGCPFRVAWADVYWTKYKDLLFELSPCLTQRLFPVDRFVCVVRVSMHCFKSPFCLLNHRNRGVTVVSSYCSLVRAKVSTSQMFYCFRLVPQLFFQFDGRFILSNKLVLKMLTVLCFVDSD